MATCRDLIMSEDINDFIFERQRILVGQVPTEPDTCVKNVDETWAIGYGRLPNNLTLSVGDLGYYTIPKLYGLMDTTSFDESGISSTLNQPTLNLRGQSVLIGFLDTGIDYLLDSFKYTRNTSKILTIWDQTIQSEGTTGSGTLDTGETITGGMTTGETATGAVESEADKIKNVLEKEFDYGSIYMEGDINRALQAQSEQRDPYAIVPSRDEDGHGTFLAGVAAAARTDEYIGAAPDARIAMVKLKPAKKYLRDYYLIQSDAITYQDTDLMLGVRFLQYAASLLKLPLVICIGLGTASGARRGASPLASQITDVSRQGNNVIVTCMGNEGNERGHVSGVVNSSTEPSQIELNVGPNNAGFNMEIWANSLDVLSVSIISPSGEQVPRIPARVGRSSIFSFILENSQVSVDYKVAEKNTGYEVIFFRFITPAEGIWRINIFSLTNIKGGYDAWLPIRSFLSQDTYFLNSTPETTLTAPSDASRPISVGAYNHVTGGIYIESGRGYTADNRVKPDIVAPGVNVFGIKNGGGYTYRTGTSIAAAHVAGAAALLLTWGVTERNSVLMGTSEVKSLLIRGAIRDPQMSYPNNVWGYGKLNLINSFFQLRVT